MRNFEGAILDLDDIEKKIEAESEEEKKDPFYAQTMLRVLIKRGAAKAWTSNFEEAEKDFNRILTDYKGLLKEEELNFVMKDLEKIQRRNKSNEFKKQGDLMYAEGRFDDALKEYQKSLSHDLTNEYALGNIGLIYMKKSDYQKCIEFTNDSLNQLNNFLNETKSFNLDNQLEVKLLLRRGKSYQMLKEYELAKKDLDECVRLDRRNKEAQSILKSVQGEINEVLYNENKIEAERLFKDQKWVEALAHFEECLKITRKASTLNNISVFVNKTACLLALGHIDLLISECNNALRLIKNLKVKDISKEDKQKAQNMEVILLLRKGKGLIKNNETRKAIEQYEAALDINPDNESIKRDVEKLKQSL